MSSKEEGFISKIMQREKLHHSKQLQPNLTPGVKQTPYSSNQVIAKIRQTSVIGYSARTPPRSRNLTPRVPKTSSNSNIKRTKNQNRSANSHSQLPSAHSLGLDKHPSMRVINNLSKSPRPSQSPQNQHLFQSFYTKLNSLNKLTPPNSKLQTLIEVLQDLIQKDKIFGTILNRLKNEFLELFGEYNKTVEKLNERLITFTDLIKQYKIEMRTAYRKLQKTSKQNYQLQKKVELQNNEISQLKLQLQQVQTTNLDSLPLTPKSWKLLLSQNEKLKQKFELQALQMQKMREKEKSLLSLFLAMKRNGYPIEDIYRAEVAPHLPKQETLSMIQRTENPSSADQPAAQHLIPDFFDQFINSP